MAVETRESFRFRDYVLEPAEHSLIKGSREIQLRPKSFEVLVHLVEHHGHLMTKGDLLDAVWPETHVTERTLTTCIWEIREALNDQGDEPRLIKTIPKVGYQFVAEVTSEPSLDFFTTRKLWKPIVFLAVSLLLVFGWLGWKNAQTHTSQTPSIAVLPFKNLSADPKDEYFSDGITDAIIDKLSRIKGLKVISRTSSMMFKDGGNRLKEIAEELNVTNLLEGSVQRLEDRVQIRAQLIEAETDTHLWSQTYVRKMGDLFRVQTDIAQRIASALEVQLSPSESVKVSRSLTSSWTAYDYYLSGRDLVTRGENLDHAIDLFEKALRVDAQFALAYVGMAHAYGQKSRSEKDSTELLETAFEKARKALSLDPDLSNAHVVLAHLHQAVGSFREALNASERASHLDPNGVAGLQLSAVSCLHLGQFDEAIAMQRKALDLNPLNPVNYYNEIARAYWYLGDDERAEEWVRRVLEIAPSENRPLFILAAIHLSRGRLQEAEAIAGFPHQKGQIAESRGDLEAARQHYTEASKHSELFVANAGRTDLARMLLNLGRAEEAEQILSEVVEQEQELLAGGREDFESPLRLARVYSIKGDRVASLEWLEKAVRAGWRGRFYWDVQIDPAWADIRQEPEFQELMADVEVKLVAMRERMRALEQEWK